MTWLYYNIPTWLSYDNRTMTFSGSPNSSDVGTFTIKVQVTDTKNQSATTTFTINVQMNYVPVVQEQENDQQVGLNKTLVLTLPTATFISPSGDTLYYSASGLPSWLSFNATSLTFTGKPTQYGQYLISVKARDDWNGTAVMNFTIIAGVKPEHPPYVNVILQNVTAIQNALFEYKLPKNAFISPDNSTLYYLVSQANGSNLPSWLEYEDVTKIISGIANANSTNISVIVYADDRKGGIVS